MDQPVRVSHHAAIRFMERTGYLNAWKAKRTLSRIAERAKPAFGYKVNGKIRLFTKEHFTADGWVLVIKNDTILTCFMADQDQCYPMS